ncbi:MAG TPA: hypothetical protein VIV11_14990 [Kofleriaceae bacterium]
MRSGVIDLGSNTFHAVVAKVDAGEVKSILLDDKIAVRLGEHAFARRRICDDAYARGFTALGELIERVRAKDCDSIAIVATGVFREASNGRRFLAEARGTYDVDIELLDGHEEARLTWLGVASELALEGRRLAVVDLGGGSLECALGTKFVESAHSLPLGMLRLRGLLVHDTRAIVKNAARHVIGELVAFAPETLALSSGTARVLLRLARSIGRIPAVARHMPARTLTELATMLTTLCTSALAELGVPQERRDTIATGALVLDTIVQAVGVRQVYIARAALREGLLASVTNSLETSFPTQCAR